jgi:glucose uptake protein GlcU
MSSLASWILPFSLLVIFEAFADIFAKEWEVKRGVYLASASLFCYMVANSFWLFALKNGSGLARGGFLFSIACTVLAVGIGWYFYGEVITTRQWVGVGLGLVSMWLVL